MITDDEFTVFLRDDSRQKVLAAELQFAYEEGGTGPFEGTVYLASHAYATRHDDVPANVPYRSCIARMGGVASRLDPVTLTGLAEIDVGSLELDNADGSLDFLLDLIIDGREIAFYLGGEGWSRADFRHLLTARMVNVEAPDEGRITIRLSAGASVLDVDVWGKELTSGPEAGKYRPLLRGCVFNLTPRLTVAADLTYAVGYLGGDGPGVVADVRDDGISLATGFLFLGTAADITVNTGTDTITKVAHGLAANDVVRFAFPILGAFLDPALDVDTDYWVISAGLTADDFRISATKGGSAIDLTVNPFFNGTLNVYRYRYAVTTNASDIDIELSAKPDGHVTVDAQSASSISRGPFEEAAELIALAQTILPSPLTSATVDTAAFTAADSALSTRYGGEIYPFGYIVDGRENLISVLKRLLDPVGGWVGVNRSGEITCGIVDPAGLASLTSWDHEISEGLIDEGSLAVANQPVRYGYAQLNYYHNLAPQPDGLSELVEVDDAALYRQEWPRQVNDIGAAGTTYASAWWSYHKSAVAQTVHAETGVNWNGCFSGTAATTEIPRELTEDNQPHRRVIQFSTGWDAYAWDIGDTVRITYPRYGLEAGVTCRVLAIERNFLEGAFRVTLITRVAPDYTSTSHH